MFLLLILNMLAGLTKLEPIGLNMIYMVSVSDNASSNKALYSHIKLAIATLKNLCNKLPCRIFQRNTRYSSKKLKHRFHKNALIQTFHSHNVL